MINLQHKIKNKILFLWVLTPLAALLYLYSTVSADTLQPAKNIVNYNIGYPTIKSDINLILNENSRNLVKTNYGIAIYSTKLNKFIYQNNCQKKLTPASNTKLFTTFTSYVNLGEDYNIPTFVYIDGKVTNKVLNGNLYLVGGGDPLLTITDIELIADAIKESGISKITGNIYGVSSYFDSITDRYKYSNDVDEVQSVAPITALSIEKNTVTVIVTSGSIPGKPVTVQYKPASSAFTTTIAATVADASNSNLEQDELDYNKDYYKLNKHDFENYSNNSVCLDYELFAGDEAPLFAATTKKKHNTNNKNKRKPQEAHTSSKNPIRIKTTASNDGCQHFTVSGSLPVNRTYTYRYYIKNPAFVAASSLKDRLVSGGVSVSGIVANKELQPEELASKTNIFTFARNINDVIVPTNKFSDNYLAETLFKLNGAVAAYDKNCAKSAILSINNTIKKLNICSDSVVLNDGSGLSRRNLVTAESLVNILHFSTKMPFYKNLDSSLSIAGIDGTLSKRMQNTLAMNNLRAKTGTLRNVSSLAGYVNTKNNDTLIFAFIFNGANVGAYKQIENKLGELLSTY